jgi:hypothetical protein
VKVYSVNWIQNNSKSFCPVEWHCFLELWWIQSCIKFYTVLDVG